MTRKAALVLNTSVSSTNAYTSDPTFPSGEGFVTYHVVTTSTAAGTPLVQVDNSTDDEWAQGGSNWQTYDAVTLPAISGATSFNIKIRPGSRRVRFKYTNASGSGTVKVRANAS